jgi:uncharacterized protein (TIGR00106 family)
MSVVGDITIVPRASTGQNLSDLVALAIGVIQGSGLRYEVGAMSTTVEGDFDEVFELFKRVHRAVADAGVDRVLTTIRLDEKKGGVTIDHKVKRFR